jgi:glycosyltransferase involved in cell wall biosynthesis
MPTNHPLKLSVMMITYNHEPYVAQALESALAQRADFPFEVVVGDDASTDRTPEILRQIQARYPHRVRLRLRDKNVGICRNFADTYAACRGEYLAILEGDDYWVDPGKLRRQVELLEHNPDCTFCFHDVQLLHKDGTHAPTCCRPDLKPFYELVEIITDNVIPNCSAVVMRNNVFGDFPAWFFELSYYDWPLHILNAQHGRIAYLNEALSVYRLHNGGAWHGTEPTRRVPKVLQIFDRVNEHLDYQYDHIFRTLARHWELIGFVEQQGVHARAMAEHQARLEAEVHRLTHEVTRLNGELSALHGAHRELLSSRAVRWAKQASSTRHVVRNKLGLGPGRTAA